MVTGATTILLAEDHQVVREGVRLLLESQADLQVIGEVSDGPGAVAAAARLRPDVLVVDITLPRLSGLDVTREVSRRNPETRIIVLSMHAAEPFVLEALGQGAAGYVVKDAGGAELVRAIREVRAGRRYVSPPLSPRVLESDQGGEPPRLTPREQVVLRLAAEGLTNADIGRRLGVSPRTVETHRANLMRKLRLSGRRELLHFALSQGLLSQ